MGRRESREIAFQSVYMHHLSGTPFDELLEFDWLNKENYDDDEMGFMVNFSKKDLIYSKKLIQGTIDNLSVIDEKISESIVDDLSNRRMGHVERAIIRIACYELLYSKDIPFKVILNEAIEIAKKYGSDYSHKFVNGILDGVRNLMDKGKVD